MTEVLVSMAVINLNCLNYKMKFSFFFIFIYALFFSQTNLYKVDTLKIPHFSDFKSRSYYNSQDAKELLFYINESPKKYKMVFTFTHSCKPCREKFPTILSFQKQYKDKLDVFYLAEMYFQKDYGKTDRYLESINNSYPIFLVDDNPKNMNSKGKYEYISYDWTKEKMGKVYRYENYIQNLVPKHAYFGYSLIIIYDENNKPIYASTYNESHEEVFSKVKSILEN